MIVTEKLVQQALAKATLVLEEVTGAPAPHFDKIEIVKANSYWGKCFTVRKLIRISSTLFNAIPDDSKAELRLMSTTIHELIHLYPKCCNHGPNFKRMAYLVNKKYPQYQVQTRTSSEEYGVKLPETDYNWKVTCPHCGKVYYHKRKLKYDIKGYSCGVCHKKDLIMERIEK